MNWYEMNQQRRRNRGERGSQQRARYAEGRRVRQGWAAVLERKSGELVAQAVNGCFGRMAEIDRDIYDSWALGTLGEK